MISIIICSINKGYLRDVSENILRTIGVEYELLVWDNRDENKGICEVYNLMATRAKFPYCCFLHEDVIFTTDQWGRILCDLFRDHPDAGVIGIAGSAYKSAMFSGWFTASPGFDYYNITHRVNGVDHLMRQPAGGEAGPHPVVCIDGVLMACRREVWADVRFDAEGLKGFHFYDIDFSLRAARKCGVIVTLDIDLFHITQGGDYGDRWVEAAIQYHERHADVLPSYRENLVPAAAIRRTELQIARIWLNRLKRERISFRNKLRWIGRQGLYGQLGRLWYPILRFLVYRPFRLYKLHSLLIKIQTPR